jgi:hypothetical protein
LPPELPLEDEKLRGALDAPPLLLLPLLPPRAQGGRSVGLMRAVCGAAARFELPKPCGARPESVVLPCAFQLRPGAGDLEPLLFMLFSELFGREPLALLLKEPFGRAPCDCTVDGGRLDDCCEGRALLKPWAVLPPRLTLPAGLFPPRFAEKEPEFIVRTGMWEAAAAGVDRATTLRFCTLAEGVAMRPRVFDAPK